MLIDTVRLSLPAALDTGAAAARHQLFPDGQGCGSVPKTMTTVSVMFEPFLSDTIDPTTGCVSAAGQRLNKWVPAARPNRFNVPNCVGVYQVTEARLSRGSRQTDNACTQPALPQGVSGHKYHVSCIVHQQLAAVAKQCAPVKVMHDKRTHSIYWSKLGHYTDEAPTCVAAWRSCTGRGTTWSGGSTMVETLPLRLHVFNWLQQSFQTSFS